MALYKFIQKCLQSLKDVKCTNVSTTSERKKWCDVVCLEKSMLVHQLSRTIIYITKKFIKNVRV